MEPTVQNEKYDSRLIQMYFRFVESLETALTGMAMVTGLLIVIITMIRVIGRYVGSPQGWTTEAAIYLAIYTSFFLAGPLIKEDNHLQIEFVFRKLRPAIQHRIRQIELALICVFGMLFGYLGLQYATTSGFRSTSLELGLDMFWAYASLPLLGIILVIFAVYKLVAITLDPDIVEEDYNQRFGVDEGIEEGIETENSTMTTTTSEVDQ